jgi:hypothetical protein
MNPPAFIFIPVVFGVGDRERTLASGLERACLECVRATPHRVVEVARQFSLFFVPVWRWNRRFLLVCDACGHVESISAEEAEELKEGNAERGMRNAE